MEITKKERAAKGGKARGMKGSKSDSANDASAKQADDQQDGKRTERADEKAAAKFRVPIRKVRAALALVKGGKRLADKVAAGELTLTKAKKELDGKAEQAGEKSKKKDKPSVKKKSGAKKSEAEGKTEPAEVVDGNEHFLLSKSFNVKGFANWLMEKLSDKQLRDLAKHLRDMSADQKVAGTK